MSVGDMFHVPFGREASDKVQFRIHALVSWKNKQGAGRYKARTYQLDGVAGVGVWRVS